MNETKKVSWGQKSFEANGKTYHITPSISIGRAVYVEEAKIELETGMKVGQTTSQLMKIWDHLQKGKMGDASVETYNQMKAVEAFYDRPGPMLRMCACFLNKEDEDLRYITDEQVREKIHDWAEEGLSKESFFLLALTFISEETAGLKRFTQITSDLVQKFAHLSAEGKLNTPISE